MQTTLALRARRLLVGAGAITVALAAVAPAAVSAAQPDLPPQALENPGRDRGAGEGQGPATTSEPRQVVVCHATSATEANPWVVTLVDAHSVDFEGHGGHEGDVVRLDLHELPADDADLGVICDDDEDDQGTIEDVVIEDEDDDLADGDEDDTFDDDADLSDGDEDDTFHDEDDLSDGDGDDTFDDEDDAEVEDQDVDDDGDDAVNDGGGNPGAGDAAPDVDPGSTPGQPVVPAPAAGDPRPPLSIHISTDSVTPEVLGATTTRIPTGQTALDASTAEVVTATSTLTSLPATGASSLQVIGLVGGLLILAGGGLELVARRRTSPLAGAPLG